MAMVQLRQAGFHEFNAIFESFQEALKRYDELSDHEFGLRRKFTNPRHDGAVYLAAFYFLGKAYLREDKLTEAIACFKNLVRYRDQIGPFTKKIDDLPHYIAEADQILNGLRAKGVDVDSVNVDQVIESSIKAKGFCFIATAVCESDQAFEVQVLRSFRDDVVLCSWPGELFVRSYYLVSPPIARFLSRHSTARVLVRACVVRPIANVCHRLNR